MEQLRGKWQFLPTSKLSITHLYSGFLLDHYHVDYRTDKITTKVNQISPYVGPIWPICQFYNIDQKGSCKNNQNLTLKMYIYYYVPSFLQIALSDLCYCLYYNLRNDHQNQNDESTFKATYMSIKKYFTCFTDIW